MYPHEHLFSIEETRKIVLPDLYKEFYLACFNRRPEKLVGTDLINDVGDLNVWAKELLEECGVDDVLSDQDFVFMMHQGYMFWYFNANGDPDPQVSGFNEAKKTRDKFGSLSHFIGNMR